MFRVGPILAPGCAYSLLYWFMMRLLNTRLVSKASSISWVIIPMVKGVLGIGRVPPQGRRISPPRRPGHQMAAANDLALFPHGQRTGLLPVPAILLLRHVGPVPRRRRLPLPVDRRQRWRQLRLLRRARGRAP